MGRTLLAKALGISNGIYGLDVNCSTGRYLKESKRNLAIFLWKKKIKLKEVLFQEIRKSGLNFANCSMTIKSAPFKLDRKIKHLLRLGRLFQIRFSKSIEVSLLTQVQLQYKEVRQKCIVILLRNARVL